MYCKYLRKKKSNDGRPPLLNMPLAQSVVLGEGGSKLNFSLNIARDGEIIITVKSFCTTSFGKSPVGFNISSPKPY